MQWAVAFSTLEGVSRRSMRNQLVCKPHKPGNAHPE
jgi:hypothetical protein